MDKTWIERVKQSMKSLKLRPEDIAPSVGVSPSNIRHYLNGSRTPPLDKLQLLSNAVGLSLKSILFGDEESNFYLPVKENSKKIKNVIPPVPVSKKSYGYVLDDDSMQNTSLSQKQSFCPGQIIIVDPEKAPSNNSYVLAKHKEAEKVIFRRLNDDGIKKKLVPNNLMYDLYYADDFEIIGVVVASLSVDL